MRFRYGNRRHGIPSDRTTTRRRDDTTTRRDLKGDVQPGCGRGSGQFPGVLISDEVGCLTYGTDAANMLFHVVNVRHRRHQTMIFTTNKALKAWGVRPSSGGSRAGVHRSRPRTRPRSMAPRSERCIRSVTTGEGRVKSGRRGDQKFQETNGQNSRTTTLLWARTPEARRRAIYHLTVFDKYRNANQRRYSNETRTPKSTSPSMRRDSIIELSRRVVVSS